MNKLHVMGLVLALSILAALLGGCGAPSADPVPADAQAPPAAVADNDQGDTAGAEAEPGQVATATPEPLGAGGDPALTDVLTEDYDDALSARNQLALGTLRLTGSDQAVDADQAGELALYWQALKALSADATSAPEEVSAVQDQITETMTPEQLAAIRAMALTFADLTDFYAEMGLAMTTPEAGETLTGPGGGGRSGMSQEEREAAKATATALGTPVGTGSGGGAARRDVLIDQVITLLAAVAAGG